MGIKLKRVALLCASRLHFRRNLFGNNHVFGSAGCLAEGLYLSLRDAGYYVVNFDYFGSNRLCDLVSRIISFDVAVYTQRPITKNKIAIHEILVLTTMERRHMNSVISNISGQAYCYFASANDIKIQDLSVTHADKIFVLGQRLQVQSYQNVHHRDFTPCVYPSTYSKRVSSKRTNIVGSKIVFWHVASTLSHLKGTFDLLTVWKNFEADDHIHLYVIGSIGDVCLDNFLHYKNVSYTGPLCWKKIVDGTLLPQPNYFIAPSYAEGLQGSLWEAAYLGARLIISDSCGLDRGMVERYAAMFSPGDLSSLVSAIELARRELRTASLINDSIATYFTRLSHENGIDLLLKRYLKDIGSY